MKRTMTWTQPSGKEMVMEVSYEETVRESEINADGHILTGKPEVVITADMVVKYDGKKIDSCWNTSFWKIIDINDSKLNAMGLTKKIWGIKVALTEETANEIEAFLTQLIADSKDDKAEKIRQNKAEEERQEKIEYAEAVITKAEKQDKIMTNEEYKAWKKNYNDLYNEGGEGYIPTLITREQYEYAKSILENL